MGLPIGAGQPLVLRLTRGQIIVDLNLIKTRAKTRAKAQDKGGAKYADLFQEDDFLEAGLPKKPKKTSPARNKAKTKGKRRLGLSSSPKLVSRRRLKN